MFSKVTYFGGGDFLDFKTGELMEPPSSANDNAKPIKLLRYCELNETRGITRTRRHCTRSKAKRGSS